MSAKPRVLICTGKFTYDGISRNIFETSKRLSNEFDITVLCWQAVRPTPNNVNLIAIQAFPSSFLFSSIKANKIFGEYDIVHVHAHYFLHGAGLFSNSPLIYTHHGVPPWYLRQGPKQWIGVFLANNSQKIFIHRVNEIITISKYAAYEVKKLYDRESHYIPNGVDFNIFNCSLDYNSIKGNFEHPLFMYVGALVKSKCVNEIIQALKIVADTYPNASLIVVGEGQKESSIRQLTDKLGLSSQVHFKKQINDALLAQYYCASDVFVTASRWELFGLPVIEAMACGKPAVVSDVYALPEHINRSGAGFIFKHGNIEELANSMIAAAANASKFKDKALSYANDFSWDKIAHELSDVYWKCLQNGKQGES